jgi:hypothetical protein
MGEPRPFQSSDYDPIGMPRELPSWRICHLHPSTPKHHFRSSSLSLRTTALLASAWATSTVLEVSHVILHFQVCRRGYWSDPRKLPWKYSPLYLTMKIPTRIMRTHSLIMQPSQGAPTLRRTKGCNSLCSCDCNTRAEQRHSQLPKTRVGSCLQ